MTDYKIGGETLKDMLTMGAALLEKNRAVIDSMNVFPVPDGDTGTNMSMTMQGAIKEIKACSTDSAGDVAKAMALGSLKGARGNSGVILSQIFRGFSRTIGDAQEIDAMMFAQALESGTASAYKAVMKPKEGTMLTVSRMIGEAVMAAAQDGANLYQLIDIMMESGEEALKLTPELLPVLKEAGVIDSGGKGLMTVLRGFKMVIDGEDAEDYAEAMPQEQAETDVLTLEDVNEIKFGYCTELFIIHLSESFTEADLERFRDKLVRIGDSVVVAHDTGFIKVHVHSNSPGKIIQLALQLGEVDKIKIENMREQNRQINEELKNNQKEIAMVAVSMGEGIDAIFNDLGVSVLIQGGQTMNPSIEAIANAIRKANARNVIVLPNNSNIILAAQQAAELSQCNVSVVPTTSVMQGISCAMVFNVEETLADNEYEMTQVLQAVTAGSITYAVRGTSYNGTKIDEGDIIGLLNNQIEAVGNNIEETFLALMKKAVDIQPEDPIITVLYGENVDEAGASALIEQAQKEFPEAEFTVQFGGQPLYYYLFSVE